MRTILPNPSQLPNPSLITEPEKTRHRGVERVGWMFTLTATAYNLVRIRNLTAAVSS
jgi:hypothetical protein